MATDYIAVLTARHPGAAWSISGNDYSTLVWHDAGSKPTKKSLDDAWPQVQYDMAVASVQAQRAERYRAEADPLFFEAQRGEDGVTMADWEAKVAQIKTELPYPVQEA